MSIDREPSASLTPFSGLTPDAVLDSLDAVGLRGDGRLLQLNSYENRVFQVFLEDGSVVVPKFYRPGRWSDEQILEEHAFATELAQAEVPVVAPLALVCDSDARMAIELSGHPPTLARSPAHRFAVSPRRAGRAPSLESMEQLEWIGRFIGRIHAVGSRQPFLHRLTLSVDLLGRSSRDWLLQSGMVPPDAEPGWLGVVDDCLLAAAEAFDRAGTLQHVRLHGDCHLNNVLWTDAGPHFVDLDDAMNGPAIQDLWMLLSGDKASYRHQIDALLRGYETMMNFDDRELGLIEALRTLRLIHHSAWLARRWDDPAFPAAFPWFGQAAYWQQQTQVLREQLNAMRTPGYIQTSS
ncbi:serine/threonine protein kinase [Piscinibacter terrae]|uniref:Stress response kinase A n=1 Tax=Piscinibacter terrae TaxID=2496871 RepID=A0A3N7HX24_9BURK|nr:serine/threonine protein kinase [Albitalea terrae]RQP26443.1 serine/threonine protein kinase [Albitalea terrae]